MEDQFLNLTKENLDREHLCCIIRSKKPHPGVEAKRAWLRERLQEGHVFRKLDTKGVVFIEYAPLETAWVPVEGDNYLYIYCLWVNGEFKGKGYGRQLMEYCLADARAKGKSGVCMLGAEKQKAWLSDQAFAEKYGFETVDTTSDGYRLLALSFDGTKPCFAENAKRLEIEHQELTVYYSSQCPYIHQSVELVRKTCQELEVPYTLIPVDTLEKAKALPCVFNNWAVFYQGKFVTVNLLDAAALKGMPMEIRKVETDKKRYLDLLLLADEQEDMVDRYLERGTMYVLVDDGVKAECVVTDEGNGILELKNIAVEPDFHGRGYGKALVEFLIRTYAGQYVTMQVGTGDSPSTIPFYESCGFRRHHLVKNFFTDHYDHPIYEGGVQLVDMVYLQRRL